MKCALYLFLLGITSFADADVLITSYHNDDGLDRLATIDTTTGVVTELFELGHWGIQAIAWDSSTSTLFGYANSIDARVLIAIDPQTGVVTPRGIAEKDESGVAGLTYDPVRDKLFGADLLGDGTARINEIDRVTGEFTPIGSPMVGGSTLEFLPATGEILFVDPFPGSLGTWNPDTATLSALGPMVPTSGLAWSTADNALYATGDNLSNLLHTIDPLTGATIDTITLSESHYYAGLTAIPGPGVMGLMLLWGGATVRRRRP